MPGGVEITWYGHGTWGHRSPGGTRIIVDPWLGGNPSCPAELAEPEVDVILVTHAHFDHTADVVPIAQRTGAPVVGKYETVMHFGGLGLENLVGFNTGGTAEVAGVRFTMTQAIHSGSISTAEGIVGYGGEPAGYVITFENGFRIYQSGDTAVFGDMALIGELYRPDLAVLSIGDFYTMGPYEAAKAVELLGVKEVVGGHWGTFPALTGTPAALREELGKRGVTGVTVHDLAAGGTLA